MNQWKLAVRSDSITFNTTLFHPISREVKTKKEFNKDLWKLNWKFLKWSRKNSDFLAKVDPVDSKLVKSTFQTFVFSTFLTASGSTMFYIFLKNLKMSSLIGNSVPLFMMKQLYRFRLSFPVLFLFGMTGFNIFSAVKNEILIGSALKYKEFIAPKEFVCPTSDEILKEYWKTQKRLIENYKLKIDL